MRYPAIKNMNLEDRIRRSTQALQDWITRVEHQKTMTLYIEAKQLHQLTIPEAFQKAQSFKESLSKYPP
jgi:hypothetical protein